VETRLAIASRREVRRYDGRPLPDDVVRRILDAGRLAGSARNRQPCRFVVAEGAARDAVARAVYSPPIVLDAALAVTLVVTPGGGLVDFDAGRAAQSMMLAAWAEGVASCPNGIADRGAIDRALGLEEPERAVVVLAFGRPPVARDPARRSAEEWSGRARRLPLEALVRRVGSPAA
jgi:nitroreductase